MNRILATIAVCLVAAAAPARAEELWIVPTYQQDIGGLGVASNVFWPVDGRCEAIRPPISISTS
jgi:hypothetical protein